MNDQTSLKENKAVLEFFKLIIAGSGAGIAIGLVALKDVDEPCLFWGYFFLAFGCYWVAADFVADFFDKLVPELPLSANSKKAQKFLAKYGLKIAGWHLTISMGFFLNHGLHHL